MSCLVASSRAHMPQTSCLHPVLLYAAYSVFLQLDLKPGVHMLSTDLYKIPGDVDSQDWFHGLLWPFVWLICSRFFCFIIYHFRILMPCVRLSWLLWAFEFTLNLWTPYLTLSVILFLCGPPVSIVVPAWQCCHHVFLHWAKGRWRLAAGE